MEPYYYCTILEAQCYGAEKQRQAAAGLNISLVIGMLRPRPSVETRTRAWAASPCFTQNLDTLLSGVCPHHGLHSICFLFPFSAKWYKILSTSTVLAEPNTCPPYNVRLRSASRIWLHTPAKTRRVAQCPLLHRPCPPERS